MRPGRICLFAVFFAVFSLPAAAQSFVFSDSDFSDADWSSEVAMTGPHRQTTARASDAGDSFRNTTVSFQGSGGFLTVTHLFATTYHPAVSGPIARLRYSLRRNYVSRTPRSPFLQYDFDVKFVLIQGGKVYTPRNVDLHLMTLRNPPAWETISETLTESGFSDDDGRFPDFSTSGAPIWFGYQTGGRPAIFGEAESTSVVGVDDWMVEVSPRPDGNPHDIVMRPVASACDLREGSPVGEGADPIPQYLLTNCDSPNRSIRVAGDIRNSSSTISSGRFIIRATVEDQWGRMTLQDVPISYGPIQPGRSEAFAAVLDFESRTPAQAQSNDALRWRYSSLIRIAAQDEFNFVLGQLLILETPCTSGCPISNLPAWCVATAQKAEPVVTPRLSLNEVLYQLETFYRMRDEVFSCSAEGKRYRSLYYEHGSEIAALILRNESIREAGIAAVRTWAEPLRDLVDGRGEEAFVTSELVLRMQELLGALRASGSPALRLVIEREEARLRLVDYTGLDMRSALAKFENSSTRGVTLPVVASLRGIPPSFFQSDARIFNPSPDTPATVTARYRCFGGTCEVVRTFIVAAGEMRVFHDIVESLFQAGGTAGAVEFEGDVIVDSRLYSPRRPDPTSGMYVPGLESSETSAESALLGLERSADFRTNAGFYNQSDASLEATIMLFDTSGVQVGQTTRILPPRTPLQINDVFAAAGVPNEIERVWALVRTTPPEPIYTYASVIDNRSQDSMFVRGRSVADREELKVIAAVASVRGVPPTFFRSDVRLLNPSDREQEVRMVYRCAPDCPPKLQITTLAAGELRTLRDGVASIFDAPQTFGTLEVSGSVHVDSRLYTPDPGEPTQGMYVPALGSVHSGKSLVVTSLSHSMSGSEGFRTNLGIVNRSLDRAVVTVTLHDGEGEEIGRLDRTISPRGVIQINNVFAAAGVSRPIPEAYARIEAGTSEVIAYASVLDNRSQDPVFVPGRRLGYPSGKDELREAGHPQPNRIE